MDVEHYLLKCKEKIQFPIELGQSLETNRVDMNSEEVWPSTKCIFEHLYFKKTGFAINYSSTFLVKREKRKK